MFKSYLSSECGLSANTINAYLSDVKMFTAAYPSNNFTANDISQFVRDNPASSATVRRRLASIKAYARFLKVTCQRSDDLTVMFSRLDAPKRESALPNVLGRGQVVELLTNVQGGKHWARDMAALETLYASGLRASELVGLDIRDIDFAARNVRVMGKGGKERLIPTGRAAVEALQRHIGQRTTGPVFPGLGRFELCRIVRRARKSAKLSREVSPHTLRHSFASHLLSGHDAIEVTNGKITVNLKTGGADIREIQEMMGHSDVATTAVYLHTDMAHLKRIHSKLGR